MPLKTFQIPIAHHFISGSWREGSEILDVIDPSSGEKMTEIARGKAADIDRAVQAATSRIQRFTSAILASKIRTSKLLSLFGYF